MEQDRDDESHIAAHPEKEHVPDIITENNNCNGNISEQKDENLPRADGNKDPEIVRSRESLSRRSGTSVDDVTIVRDSSLSGDSKRAVFRDFLDWQNKTEKQYSDRGNPWIRVWKDHCILLTSYFIGIVGFVICFHMRQLPVLPFPVIRNLEDWNPDLVPYIWWSHGAILVECLWVYTHLRRSLFLVLTSFRSSPVGRVAQSRDAPSATDAARTRTYQCLLGACAVLYHVVFGTWLGWANNAFCGYMTSDKEFIISGLVAYSVGELTITTGDIYFLCRNTSETVTFRKFRLSAEIFIWTGFALVSFTLPAVFLFLSRFAILTFFLQIPERPICVCLC